jgi:hypothetical protein
VGFALLLSLLAGCSASTAGTGYVAPGTPVAAPPVNDTVTFTLEQFPDATVDVTLNVVDSSTLATLFNQVSAAQSPPISASFSMIPAPINVSMSVKFNFLLAKAVRSGTNTGGGGATLTDLAATFTTVTFPAPLFVINNPPTVIADVVSITPLTTLNLGSAFPNGTYYLFQARQLAGSVGYTHSGTDTRGALFTDNTLGTLQFTTSF